VFENSAASSYHALQIEARKRYSQGFQFTASYTWSHAIDDVSDVFPIAGAPILAQDSLNLRAEKGNANFDVRHQFAGSLVWDLPFFRSSKGRLKRLAGGWQIASIFEIRTGQPFTLGVPFDANLDGNLTDRPQSRPAAESPTSLRLRKQGMLGATPLPATALSISIWRQVRDSSLAKDTRWIFAPSFSM
jgi:hypothetical protein